MEETRGLVSILQELKGLIIHRAVIAWERSPESFSEEIVAFNDVNEAITSFES